jgi:protein-disulfide isomerase
MTATKTAAPRSRRAERYAEQLRSQRRRRRRIVLSSVVGFVLAVTAVGMIVGAARHASSDAATSTTPPHVTASGGIVVGSSTAPVRVVEYADPQCPVCARFEFGNGRILAAAVRDGRVSVEYRMRSFLGPESVRAVNALAAAQVEGRFEELRELLFVNQPAEGTGGYTAETLIDLGRQAGITSSRFATSVRELRFAAWVARVDDQASRDGNVATPELRIDGRPLSNAVLFDEQAFRAAIAG